MVEQQPGQVISPNDQPPKEPSSVQNSPQPEQEAATPIQQPPAQQPIPTTAPAATSNPSTTQQQPYSAQEVVTASPSPTQAPATTAPVSQQPTNPPKEAEQQPLPTQEPSAGFTTSGFEQSDMMPESDDYDAGESSDITPISWTASEYIAHSKNPAWFLALAVLVVLVAAGVYLLTKDILSGIVIIVVGIVFGMYAGRKPREQTYAVNEAGVVIGNKLYGYDVLKSFTVHQEDAFPSITFTPFGRFMPPISMYYAPQDEERIIAALSVHLPYETYKRDPVDTLMRKIRF